MSEAFKLAMKTDENKLRRGWIIRILNYFQHEKSREVNDALIRNALDEVGYRTTMPTLHADLRYLSEKGYVELREPSPTNFNMMVAAISANGVDLYEGSIKDIGVDFGHES